MTDYFYTRSPFWILNHLIHCIVKARTFRLENSFYPQAIRLLNHWTTLLSPPSLGNMHICTKLLSTCAYSSLCLCTYLSLLLLLCSYSHVFKVSSGNSWQQTYRILNCCSAPAVSRSGRGGTHAGGICWRQEIGNSEVDEEHPGCLNRDIENVG